MGVVDAGVLGALRMVLLADFERERTLGMAVIYGRTLTASLRTFLGTESAFL
jgi:hypothetical protein